MITGKMSGNRILSQSEFAHLVPHSGSMLLIDEVLSWSQDQIVTRCISHQNPHHPLRLHGKLSAIHLIEYGAQTMAVHCGLLTGRAHPGFLAAVRAVNFYVDDLDSIKDALIIKACAELQLQNGAVYYFSVTDIHGATLLDARATVVHLQV
jgi:predicted hotdog family 3-hydroxylacyl-ACP dehydratase